jgi:hypothetical protein
VLSLSNSPSGKWSKQQQFWNPNIKDHSRPKEKK